MVLLCAHHHRVIHHDGWAVHIGEDGLPAFTPPAWLDPGHTPVTGASWRRRLGALARRIENRYCE